MSEYEIILIQSLHIRDLNEAISELITLVADQYNQIHKPKHRKRKGKLIDAKT